MHELVRVVVVIIKMELLAYICNLSFAWILSVVVVVVVCVEPGKGRVWLKTIGDIRHQLDEVALGGLAVGEMLPLDEEMMLVGVIMVIRGHLTGMVT